MSMRGGIVEDISGGVDGAKPRFQLTRHVHRHEPQEGLISVGGGDNADGPQVESGER